MNILNETTFEDHIAGYLAQSDLYNQRRSGDFTIDTLCDREMLEKFLKAQELTWKKLSTRFPGKEVDTVIAEYNKLLNRGESILTILRKGFTIQGAKVKFCAFKPALAGEESDMYKLYRANTFSVVRQMRYSNDDKDKGNELDLCILINGIPLMTFELKNEGTNQNYGHGIYQYRYERNANNRMLRNCLVHFVMDNNYAFMTTFLNGEDTNFLPFNQDSTNPPIEGDYPTAYMWREILQADSLLDIVENFIKRYREDDKTLVIFPRYHQMRAVRKLRQMVREEGPGHNYLIEHSAGSGKTKSMAWLAHQLANMTNIDKTPIFDTVIMVTDRIVLNRNMADDVKNFETVAGTVKDIRRGSKNLATALNEGHRIIISTVQKFSFAIKDLKRETSRKYAIIVDEAHTAIGNESAKDLANALSTDEDLKAMPDFNPEEFDTQMDALMAYMQVMRRQMPHISYFAFTATPKDKTYALFGTKDGKAHDLYSMKQAIDEKFILDVLQNYKSYKTMFGLIEKDDVEDKDKLFEEKKSLKLIYDELNKNPYIMLRKANMMLEHFTKHTMNKIGKKAKAMVVTDSRRSAADYKRLLDKLIATNYDNKFKTLVAFSGEVEDSHGRRCTEANMNENQVTDNDIAIQFKEDDYKLLIVADKFQTGFDQPLLHTMYVDKSLGGIQCIQTLSRLNRCYPGKDDTMVIDFRNDVDDVQKAFQRYYTETILEGEVDPQRMYALKSDVEEYNIFNEDEVNEVVEALLVTKNAAKVPSIFKKIVVDRVDPLEDAEKDRFRKLVDRYVRQYGFMAQLMEFTDPDLEKFYVFCKFFYRYLPYTKETLPSDILERIDLDKLRIQMAYEGQLELEDETQTLASSRIGEPGKKKEDEMKTVAEILDVANEPYAEFLDENDKILRQIWDEILVDPEITDAFNAEGNTYDILINLVKEKFDMKVAEQIDKVYNFAEIIEREKSLSLTLISKFVDAIAKRTASHKVVEYDEEKLKAALVAKFGLEFDGICEKRVEYSLEEAVDCMFDVLNTPSVQSLDGVGDIIRNSMNYLYTVENIRPVDKQLYLNSLLPKFESYLKKLYYHINGVEVPLVEKTNKRGETYMADPSLEHVVKYFDCLTNLRNSASLTDKRLQRYFSDIWNLRNQESHVSPVSESYEVEYNIQKLVTMFIYVTLYSMSDLALRR